MTVGTLPVALGDMFARGHEFSDGGVQSSSFPSPRRAPHLYRHRGMRGWARGMVTCDVRVRICVRVVRCMHGAGLAAFGPRRSRSRRPRTANLLRGSGPGKDGHRDCTPSAPRARAKRMDHRIHNKHAHVHVRQSRVWRRVGVHRGSR
jgi:hypothetical protein